MKRKEARYQAKLRKIVSKYLDEYVKTPSLETVDKDFFAQSRLVSLLVIVKNLIFMVNEHGTDFDEEYLSNLSDSEINEKMELFKEAIDSGSYSELEERVDVKEMNQFMLDAGSKKFLLVYLERELNWIAISILSASYISSLILMRAIFELIVAIASPQTDSMKTRIANITFLEESEKKELVKLWYQLCAWGHPYGKWIKEICPVYSAHSPIYHPALCEMCMKKLDQIVDLFAVVILNRFKIEPIKFVDMANKFGIDITGLELLETHLAQA